MLEVEYNFFEKNRDNFIKEHNNEYVIIKGEEAIGFFLIVKLHYMKPRKSLHWEHS